jgi:GGDEF domain-containing protein
MRVDAARFRTALVEAYSRAHKAGQPLAVWWLDVDDCSRLNDLFGEEAVNARLKAFEERLLALIGECDGLLTRNGSAWAVALPGWNGPDSKARAEILRRQWSQDAGTSFGLSVGIACKKVGEPALNLLEEAELACTRAKQAGRDQVILR